MAYFLGVDAGGTKSDCALGDEKSVLAQLRGGSVKLQRVGEAAARETLHGLLRQLCDAAQVSPREVVRTCIGAAGASDPRVVALLTAMCSEVVGGEVAVVPDFVIAHEAAFSGTPGIVVISGTGSIAYGRNARGETARAGGWGPIVSDEGSSEWVGRRAVAAAVRAHDTGQNTALTRAILQAWQIATREDLVRMANALPRPDFAGLYQSVLAAATAGDALASEVLMAAATELASLTKIVLRRLWPGRQAVRVCTAGGVFTSSQLVRRVFNNALRAERPDVAVSFGHVHPVAGALAMARRSQSNAGAAR